MGSSFKRQTGFSEAMHNLIAGRIQELAVTETELQETLVAKRRELKEAKTEVQKLEDDWKDASDLVKAIRDERMALENDTLLMVPTVSRGNHNPAQLPSHFSDAMHNLIAGRIQELAKKETESQATLVAKRGELEEAKAQVQRLKDDWKAASDLVKATRNERMALENDTLLMAPTSSRGNHNPARGMLSSMKKANGMLSAYIGDVLYPLVIAASRGMSTVVKKANGMLSAYIGDALFSLIIAAAQGMHSACLYVGI
eukprot:scaffold13999_cov34-Cyclotella_meneghiniana.AAC.1